MDLLRDQEVDSLSSLEERILRTVELVNQLREEKDAALRERDLAVLQAAEARRETDRLAQEMQSLRSERTQVRSRIEKLLGQMDALAAG